MNILEIAFTTLLISSEGSRNLCSCLFFTDTMISCWREGQQLPLWLPATRVFMHLVLIRVEYSNQRGVADSNNLRNNIVQNLKFLLPSSYALILHKWSLMVRFNALQWGSNRKIRRSWLKLPVFLYLTLEFVRNTQLFLYVDILSAMLTVMGGGYV